MFGWAAPIDGGEIPLDPSRGGGDSPGDFPVDGGYSSGDSPVGMWLG